MIGRIRESEFVEMPESTFSRVEDTFEAKAAEVSDEAMPYLTIKVNQRKKIKEMEKLNWAVEIDIKKSALIPEE